MLAAALVLGAIFGPALWTTLTPDLPSVLVGSLAALAMLAVVLAAVEGPLGRGSRLRRDVDQLAGLLRSARPADLVLISVLAGAGEEALFRGFLLHHAMAWMGAPLGIAITSLLFGLFHAISMAYVVFATLLGLVMCALYLWSDNLALPIVTHAVYDLGALAYIKYLRAPPRGRQP